MILTSRIVYHPSGLTRRPVPHSRSFTLVLGRAFDLVRRSGDAILEALRKLQIRKDVPRFWGVECRVKRRRRRRERNRRLWCSGRRKGWLLHGAYLNKLYEFPEIRDVNV